MAPPPCGARAASNNGTRADVEHLIGHAFGDIVAHNAPESNRIVSGLAKIISHACTAGISSQVPRGAKSTSTLNVLMVLAPLRRRLSLNEYYKRCAACPHFHRIDSTICDCASIPRITARLRVTGARCYLNFHCVCSDKCVFIATRSNVGL